MLRDMYFIRGLLFLMRAGGMMIIQKKLSPQEPSYPLPSKKVEYPLDGVLLWFI